MNVLVKIKAQKILENGKQANVVDQYLFTGVLSFMEAEKTALAELAPYYSGEWAVDNISKKNYLEIVRCQSGSNRYYAAKLAFITIDEKSGSEKKMMANYLVEAENFQCAVTFVENFMEGSMADYEIVSLSETKILDVYEYGIH